MTRSFKFQALVFDILPPATAIISNAIGPPKLSSNEPYSSLELGTIPEQGSGDMGYSRIGAHLRNSHSEMLSSKTELIPTLHRTYITLYNTSGSAVLPIMHNCGSIAHINVNFDA